MRYPSLPVVLSALSLALLGVGLPFARRFRRPGRYIGGVIATALGLTSFWLLQVIVLATVELWETRWLLHLLSLIVSVSLIAGGVKAISRANNTPRDDYYEDRDLFP